MIGEANLIFVYCVENCKDEKHFSTYLYQSLKGLLDKARKDNAYACFEELQPYHHPSYVQNFSFIEDLELSVDAQSIVDIVFDAPLDEIEGKKNKITKEALTVYLKRTKGWKTAYIRHLFYEISEKLEEII